MSTHLNASRNASSPSSSSSSSTPASSSSSSSPHLDSPVAPRPTRSEYASYTAMLRHLDARESGKLSRRLIDSQATLAFDHPPPNDDSTPKRKWQTAKEEISTHWPLAPVDLPRPPVTLENAIISFASSHLRAHRPTSSQPEISLVEGDVTLPPSLVSSTKEFVNQILVGMALMRPVDVARKRRLMRRISWHGVLGAASLTCEDHEVLTQANDRLRGICKITTPEISLFSHRLSILSETRARRSSTHLATSLYASFLPMKDETRRPHQSKAGESSLHVHAS
ncbi:MAG: hypothetical protein TREMPRED_000771 [Tremellales sp. Tagirdzhanova-0007]|nr:MAG: hypothetical protein TREMPRED_000771 [Tremellales sp. Tagirdzhanova-0007]